MWLPTRPQRDIRGQRQRSEWSFHKPRRDRECQQAAKQQEGGQAGSWPLPGPASPLPQLLPAKPGTRNVCGSSSRKQKDTNQIHSTDSTVVIGYSWEASTIDKLCGIKEIAQPLCAFGVLASTMGGAVASVPVMGNPINLMKFRVCGDAPLGVSERMSLENF